MNISGLKSKSIRISGSKLRHFNFKSAQDYFEAHEN